MCRQSAVHFGGGAEWSSLAAGYEHEPPKAAAYECIVLAILIFGCLGARDAAAAATHAARVTRKHTWPHHIATKDLTRRLGLDSADSYVARRQLDRLTRPRGPHGLLAAAHRMLS